MGAKFIVRFDDICPTMNWSVWADVERIIEAYQIKPIVAVVPDNRDPHLQVDQARDDFWDLVREWQRRQWSIGWHGYTHVYRNSSAGLIGVHRGSEFADLSEEEQRHKLDAAEKIFRERDIVPAIWVAPGHSFDWTTVRLVRERGVTAISDGYFVRAIQMGGCAWIPQQLWRFRNMPMGLWTVCYHHNAWKSKDVAQFEADVARFRDQIVPLSSVLRSDARTPSLFDRVFSSLYRTLVLTRRSRRSGLGS